MFAFISTFIMIWLAMWVFYKFMYPKPPKSYLPQEGDVVTPRRCDYCGHFLEEYRGILEKKPTADTIADVNQAQGHLDDCWFFCNAEHQADFHAGKTYVPHGE